MSVFSAIASAAIGAGASLIGAETQADAAEDAADAQLQAAREAIDFQREAFGTVQQNLDPFRLGGQNAFMYALDAMGVPRPVQTAPTTTGTTGTGAAGTGATAGAGAGADAQPAGATLWFVPDRDDPSTGRTIDSTSLGTPPGVPPHPGAVPLNGGSNALINAPASTAPAAGQAGAATQGAWQAGELAPPTNQFGQFFTSPGYQFRLDEGIKALDRSAAARGMLMSGPQVKAVQRYGEGLASAEYGDYVNRLLQLTNVGQSSAAQVGTAAQGTANQSQNALLTGAANAGNARMTAGASRASGFAGVSNSVNAGIQNYMLGQQLGLWGGGTPNYMTSGASQFGLTPTQFGNLTGSAASDAATNAMIF